MMRVILFLSALGLLSACATGQETGSRSPCHGTTTGWKSFTLAALGDDVCGTGYPVA